MDLEIGKLLFAIVIILIIIFVIKNFKGILVGIGVGLLTLFLAIFVVKDMLHFPIDKYIDTTGYDRFQNEGLSYIEEKLDEVTDDEVKDKKGNDDVSNYLDNKDVSIENLNSNMVDDRISYDGLTKENRLTFILRNKDFIEDGNFERKVMGMSNYVNITYDLGNAILRNSEDGKYIVLEYK